MNKYNYCTSKIFKKDLEDLCENCPLVERINNGIKKQILFQANEKKGILSKNQFKTYLEKEIENASKSMERVFLTEQQNIEYKTDPHRKKRIEIYIWNKERIKALNSFFINTEENKRNPHSHLFKKADTYHKFNKYTQNHIVEYYSDYSFLFQSLLHKELIHPTKHLAFMKWLFKEKYISEKHYDKFTSKGHFKSYDKSSSIQRENNFNNIFQ